MINPAIKCYTWDDMHHLCNGIAKQLEGSGLQVDAIVGILRGGAFPALLLSHRLRVPRMYTLRVRTTETEEPRAARRRPIVEGARGLPNFEDQAILLVDDVTNTGTTLRAARDSLAELKPRLVVSATLVWDTAGDGGAVDTCAADFFEDKISSWACFPWETQ